MGFSAMNFRLVSIPLPGGQRWSAAGAIAAGVLALVAADPTAAAAAPEAKSSRPAADLSTPARADDFAYGMPIITATDAESSAWRLSLPLEVYRALVRTDHGDLRVFNARGEPVPYQLRQPPPTAAPVPPSRVLPLFALRGDPAQALREVRVRIESAGAALSVEAPAAPAPAAALITAYIVDARALAQPIAAFDLQWPETAAQFAGRLRVESSGDLGNWSPVAAGSIANLSAGGARLVESRIEVPAQAARYWRFSWEGAAAPFEFTSVRVRPVEARAERLRATTSATGTPIPTRAGEWEFDLGAELPVDRVDVVLPETNTVAQATLAVRISADQPWTTIVPDLALYRLSRPAGELRNAPRAIGAPPRRYWRLQTFPVGALNAGTPPTLEVGWPAHELWFIPRGPAPFQLAYGSARVAPAETALDAILGATTASPAAAMAVGTAGLGPAQALGGESRRVAPPPPFPWRSVILWAVLGLGVLLLGWMALRLLRDTRTEPS